MAQRHEGRAQVLPLTLTLTLTLNLTCWVRLTMEEVIPIIKGWWDELQSYKVLRSFRSRLVTRLSTRVTGTSEQEVPESPINTVASSVPDGVWDPSAPVLSVLM